MRKYFYTKSEVNALFNAGKLRALREYMADVNRLVMDHSEDFSYDEDEHYTEVRQYAIDKLEELEAKRR